MRKFIPYGTQDVTDADIQSVIEVLKSNFLTQEPTVESFEQELQQVTQASYVTAVPNTFVASANCALYCGERVDFVDIDPLTSNLSVELLEQKLNSVKCPSELPKVVIPVHLSGEPCNKF